MNTGTVQISTLSLHFIRPLCTPIYMYSMLKKKPSLHNIVIIKAQLLHDLERGATECILKYNTKSVDPLYLNKNLGRVGECVARGERDRQGGLLVSKPFHQ